VERTVTTAETARAVSEPTGPALVRTHFAGFELLRAIAAAMVVVHHADAFAGPARTGRWHELAAVADGGVAVFFVLSGFLIYRPFVAAHLVGRPGPRPLGFWWRRLVRIVPAYWVVLTFFWALGSFRLGSDWWRYYAFVQIYSKETALGGVVQAWSLCTEMSFYLVVPAIGAVLARLGTGTVGRRAAVQLAGVGALWAAGWVARAAIEQVAPSYRGLSFNWLPTNLDLFATGMAIAVASAWAAHDDGLRARLDRLARPAELWWLAAAALFAWYAYRVGPAVDFAVGYEGWFWHRRQLVLGVVTLLLLVPAVFGGGGPLRRLFEVRWLAWVGTVSYGLYLWHFDWMKRSIARVDPFGLTSWPGWVQTPPGDSNFWWLVAVGMGVGLVFAAASWYLIEQPVQRWKDRFDRRVSPSSPPRSA
jgi:peptidoglycan/LPS O-acetylase OafA/YrhL